MVYDGNTYRVVKDWFHRDIETSVYYTKYNTSSFAIALLHDGAKCQETQKLT